MSQSNENVLPMPGIERQTEVNIRPMLHIPEGASLCPMKYEEKMPATWSGSPSDFFPMPISGGKGKDAQRAFRGQLLANCTVIDRLLEVPVDAQWCGKRIVILGSEYMDLDRHIRFFQVLIVDESGNIKLGRQMKEEPVPDNSFALVHLV